MNLIQIAGRLGADPEARFTPSGQKVTNLRVATNSRRGGKDETIWWRITLWGDRFDKMISYLNKGSAIMVAGRMHKPEIYVNRNGEQQVSMDITAEMLEFSPFGRADKAAEEGSQSTEHSTPSGPSESSYEGSSFTPSESYSEGSDLSMAYEPASSESSDSPSDPSSSSSDEGLPF